MKNQFRTKLKLSVLSLGLTFAFLGASAQAGSLSDELEGMFANVTSAGSFQTTLRNGWAGGGIGVRGPIKNITIISFDPPRLSAGCGGIDFFGGSFSFINSEQLIALFRAIAMNAVGVAFKTAIDAINPMLGAVMQDFQAIVQALNIGNANTCAIASSIVKRAASYAGINESTKADVTGEKTALGSFADTLKSFTDGWITDSQKLARDAAKSENMEEAGNWTWKALGRSKVADNLPDPITGENNAKANKEFVMSVIGTMVIGGQPNTSSTTSEGNSAAPTRNSLLPTIDLAILRTGPQEKNNQKILKMRCEEVSGGTSTIPDGACDKVSTVEIGKDFKGVFGYVSKMFFGHEYGKSVAPTDDSILTKMFYCSDVTVACSMTTEQQKFLASIKGPAVRLLIKTQHDRTLAAHVIDGLLPIIATQYYYQYLETFEQAARMAYSGPGQQMPPDVVEGVVTKLHAEKLALREEMEQQIPKFNSVITFVDRVIADRSGPMPALK